MNMKCKMCNSFLSHFNQMSESARTDTSRSELSPSLSPLLCQFPAFIFSISSSGWVRYPSACPKKRPAHHSNWPQTKFDAIVLTGPNWLMESMGPCSTRWLAIRTRIGLFWVQRRDQNWGESPIWDKPIYIMSVLYPFISVNIIYIMCKNIYICIYVHICTYVYNFSTPGFCFFLSMLVGCYTGSTICAVDLFVTHQKWSGPHWAGWGCLSVQSRRHRSYRSYIYMHIPLCMGHQMVVLENTPSSTAIGQRSKVMPHFFFSQRVVPDVSRVSWGTWTCRNWRHREILIDAACHMATMWPLCGKCYPLVNVYITMENHHFSWENPL